jgi:transposase
MKRAEIKLTNPELKFLDEFKHSGRKSEREYDRANVLLLLSKGKKDAEIEDFLGVNRITIWRIRKSYLENGLEKALKEKPRSGQPKKYKARQEAEIVAMACSDPPEGRTRWTLELLTEQLSNLEGLEMINRESIRLILKKKNVNLG